MATPWLNSSGQVILDSEGRVVVCEECPCGVSVPQRCLLWNANYNDPFPEINLQTGRFWGDVHNAFNAIGITPYVAATNSGVSTLWSGSIHDYPLIVVSRLTSQPSWFQDLYDWGTGSGTGASLYSGRIAWGTGYTDSFFRDYTWLHGLSLDDDEANNWLFGASPGERCGLGPDAGLTTKGMYPDTSHHLCAGLEPWIKYGSTSANSCAAFLSGNGRNVAFGSYYPTETFSHMRTNVVAGIEWLATDDQVFVFGDVDGSDVPHGNFHYNLVNVPIPADVETGT